MNTDSHSYRDSVHHPRTRRKILELMEKCELTDVWREIYPEKRGYTWRRFNTTKQGRLGYFLISEQILPEIQGIQINPSCRSDHFRVSLELKTENRKNGRQFRKLNNSHLKEKNYITTIKRLILALKKQYT